MASATHFLLSLFRYLQGEKSQISVQVACGDHIGVPMSYLCHPPGYTHGYFCHPRGTHGYLCHPRGIHGLRLSPPGYPWVIFVTPVVPMGNLCHPRGTLGLPLSSGESMGYLKKFSQFRKAVWPANIYKIYVYSNI